MPNSGHRKLLGDAAVRKGTERRWCVGGPGRESEMLWRSSARRAPTSLSRDAGESGGGNLEVLAAGLRTGESPRAAGELDRMKG